MNRSELTSAIRQKKSYLCVGLDTYQAKLPLHLQSEKDCLFQFNKQIIDATKDFCVCYKMNIAFYEVLGTKGWDVLERTLDYIPSSHFKIADAKRGDIGNTSSFYAKTFFETFAFDAVTVSPYMGEDSIRPFLDYEDKFTIVLGLTSNKGAKDFEMCKIVDDKYVYEKVISTVSGWGTPENLMFVAGATHATELINIRHIIPDNFLLIPGIGYQGGSLKEVSKYGMNRDGGILVNAARSIIYASSGENFAEAAASVAKEYQQEMQQFLY